MRNTRHTVVWINPRFRSSENDPAVLARLLPWSPLRRPPAKVKHDFHLQSVACALQKIYRFYCLTLRWQQRSCDRLPLGQITPQHHLRLHLSPTSRARTSQSSVSAPVLVLICTTPPLAAVVQASIHCSLDLVGWNRWKVRLHQRDQEGSGLMKGTGSGSHHQKHVEVLTRKNKGEIAIY